MGIEEILNLMIKYELSADEVMVIYLIFKAKLDNHKDQFEKWYNNGGKDVFKDLYESLMSKQIINKSNKNVRDINDIDFNKTFIKQLFKYSNMLGQDLFEKYEPFAFVNGTYIPLKNISKKFNSLEDCYYKYSSQIGHSMEKHKEVMELLEWAKQNRRLKYTICEFIISKKWEEIKYVKENHLDGELASSFDVYDSL